jgi:formamidopyrimidine-DNA glycosylase
MKMALKHKNDEFLVMPLKHVLSVMDLVNHYRTPKLWAIAHENGPKTQKRRVFGHASQTCTECHGLVNHYGTPKLWAIAHKNGPKMQK